MREQLRAALAKPRTAALVLASVIVLAALFVVSWAIYMPVGALVVAPITLTLSLLFGAPPPAHLNSLAAFTLSGLLAGATVTATFRVLMRRARARWRRSQDA